MSMITGAKQWDEFLERARGDVIEAYKILLGWLQDWEDKTLLSIYNREKGAPLPPGLEQRYRYFKTLIANFLHDIEYWESEKKRALELNRDTEVEEIKENIENVKDLINAATNDMLSTKVAISGYVEGPWVKLAPREQKEQYPEVATMPFEVKKEADKAVKETDKKQKLKVKFSGGKK